MNQVRTEGLTDDEGGDRRDMLRPAHDERSVFSGEREEGPYVIAE